MVSLSNPSGLAVMAGMAFLGSRRDQKNRVTDRSLTAGLNGKQIVSGSVGANAAPRIGQEVQNRAPGGVLGNMSSPAVQALTAAGVSWLGRDGPLSGQSSLTNPFAAGMLYSAGSEALNEAGMGVNDMLNGGGTSSNTASAQTYSTSSSAASMNRSRPTVNRGGGDFVDY